MLSSRPGRPFRETHDERDVIEPVSLDLCVCLSGRSGCLIIRLEDLPTLVESRIREKMGANTGVGCKVEATKWDWR